MLSLLFAIGVIIGTLVFIPIASLGFALPKIAVFSLTAFLGVLCVGVRLNSKVFIKTWAGRVLLIYVAILLLSSLWSIAPIVSILGAAPRFEGVLSHTVFLTIGIFAFFLTQHTQGKITLLLTILLSNTTIVLYGISQLLGIDPFAGFFESAVMLGRVFSTLGQPNVLGQFILLTLPFVILQMRMADGWMRKSILALVLLNIIVLLATGSRAAVLGLVVICALAIITTGWRSKNMIFGFLCIVLITAAVLSLSIRSNEDLWRSSSAHAIIWQDAVQMIRERPQGWGLETMGIIYPRFQNPRIFEFERLTAGVDRAHSKPLELLVTLGPLGLLSYYAFLILLLVSSANIWKREKNEIALAGFLGITGFSFSLLFGFENSVTYVFFWIVCGILLGLKKQQKIIVNRLPAGRQGYSLLVTRSVLFLMAALTLASTLTSMRWIHARFLMNQADRSLAQGDITLSLQTYSKARRKAFGWDRVIIINEIETALHGLEMADDAVTKKNLDVFITDELKQLERLTSRHDGMIPLLRAWQIALVLPSRKGAIDANLLDAYTRMPRSITFYRIAMHISEILGDTQKKEELRSELLELLPSSWNDPLSKRGRILRKENPWLSVLYPI